MKKRRVNFCSAKQKIREEGIAFELPTELALSKRIDTVLEVLYLIFNEGYNAYKGDSVVRRDFCEEAIRLTGLFLKGPLASSPKIPTVKALLAQTTSRHGFLRLCENTPRNALGKAPICQFSDKLAAMV